MSGGCGREDGGWRQTYHIHPSTSLDALCGKMAKEKNCNVSDTVTKEEFAAGEMCVSIKAAMRMLAANEDELAMVALFCSFLRVCVDGNE